MVTRKQFLINVVNSAVRSTGAIFSSAPPFCIPESPHPVADTQRLFQKAMALGIDPGTMDIVQLARLVQQAEPADKKPCS
jgi:hypothetical protein